MAKTAARSENKLTASVRTETGKGASRRARRDGKVPAVLYGHGADPQHLLLSAHDFAAVLRHTGTNAVLTLDIEGKEALALTKSLGDPPDPAQHPARRPAGRASRREGDRRGQRHHRGRGGPGHAGHPGHQHHRDRVRRLSIPEQLTVSVEGADIGTQFTAGSIDAARRRHADLRSRDARRQRRRRADRRGPRGRGRRRGSRGAEAEAAAEGEEGAEGEERRGRRRCRRILRVTGVLVTHGRAPARGGPGQSRAQLRHDAAQPRLHGRRHPRRPHGSRSSRCTRSLAPRSSPAGLRASRSCWPNRGCT